MRMQGIRYLASVQVSWHLTLDQQVRCCGFCVNDMIPGGNGSSGSIGFLVRVRGGRDQNAKCFPRSFMGIRRAEWSLVLCSGNLAYGSPALNGSSWHLLQPSAHSGANLEGDVLATESINQTTEARKGSGFRFATATLAVLGITSTLAQYLSLASLGHLQEVEPQVSTGGLFALIAAIVMWVKCPSWSSWKKWIWPLVAIGAVLAIVAVNLNVQVWQEETRIAEQRAIDEAKDEAEAERQATLACDQLYDQIQDTAERNAEYAEAGVVDDGGWRNFVWKYDSERYERELQQLEDNYMRTC